ncbi:MAG: hypothetical protein KHX03_00975 [Clostridium sp.]|nr:hypothetical protein [Clostridium sp.]
MSNNFNKQIASLTDEISKRGDVYELYYQRGYFYFLSDDNEKAKDDYIKAISLGLDPTELPYYPFSNSNSKRREFLLPEKIMVFLLLIMIIVALLFQIYSFLIKLKGSI